MIIKIKNKYIMRRGEITGSVFYSHLAKDYPFRAYVGASEYSWNANGEFVNDRCPSGADLVMEW